MSPIVLLQNEFEMRGRRHRSDVEHIGRHLADPKLGPIRMVDQIICTARGRVFWWVEFEAEFGCLGENGVLLLEGMEEFGCTLFETGKDGRGIYPSVGDDAVAGVVEVGLALRMGELQPVWREDSFV